MIACASLPDGRSLTQGSSRPESCQFGLFAGASVIGAERLCLPVPFKPPRAPPLSLKAFLFFLKLEAKSCLFIETGQQPKKIGSGTITGHKTLMARDSAVLILVAWCICRILLDSRNKRPQQDELGETNR
jgi:hypothetical protein